MTEEFHENGYVVIENAVRPEYLAALQALTADLKRFGSGRNLLAADPLFEELIDGRGHAGLTAGEGLRDQRRSRRRGGAVGPSEGTSSPCWKL